MRALTLLVDENVVAALLHEHRDRHAPGALARHHPVRAVGDHAGDAVFARGGHPAGFADGRERDIAQGSRGCVSGERLVHRDEPLRRVAEDHRLLGAPACGYWCFSRPRADDVAGRDQCVHHAALASPFLPLSSMTRSPSKPGLPRCKTRPRPPCRGCACRCRARCSIGWFAIQMSKSSRPWPGAVCTKPVPVSSVTWSPSSSGTSKS